jgi:purine-binding chemotaxis protein CheW
MIPPGDSEPPDGREELLREAERLIEAGREKGTEETGPARSFLVFSLGKEWYAIDLVSVRKVIRPVPFARVPGAMPEVLGLMNSQGEVLCILDLRKILGKPAGESDILSDGRLVIVVAAGGKEAGVLVDTVDDVWEMPASAVGPTLESLDPARAKMFEGTIERGGRFVGLISAPMCLNP